MTCVGVTNTWWGFEWGREWKRNMNAEQNRRESWKTLSTSEPHVLSDDDHLINKAPFPRQPWFPVPCPQTRWLSMMPPWVCGSASESVNEKKGDEYILSSCKHTHTHTQFKERLFNWRSISLSFPVSSPRMTHPVMIGWMNVLAVSLRYFIQRPH